MVKIDIISGFLGAGKTTLIKKLLKDGFQGEQVVLIENEFGEIGIDGGFLKEAGIRMYLLLTGWRFRYFPERSCYQIQPGQNPHRAIRSW